MSEELTIEERVLRAVKQVLTSVVKDTSTPPGMKHPLTDKTLEDIRQCFGMITAREQELADEHGRDTSARPRFIDEPTKQDNVVVAFEPPENSQDS